MINTRARTYTVKRNYRRSTEKVMRKYRASTEEAHRKYRGSTEEEARGVNFPSQIPGLGLGSRSSGVTVLLG